jgi:hypothetical protein
MGSQPARRRPRAAVSWLAGGLAALVLAVAALNARPAVGQANALGTPVVAEGKVAMSVEDDFQSGRATLHYFLDQSGSGRRYDLRLTPSQANRVRPGMSVRVMGRLAGSVLTADQDDRSVVILDAPAARSPGTAR